MSGGKKAIKMTKGNDMIVFNIVIHIGCFKLSSNITAISTQSGTEMHIQKAHASLGHSNIETTQSTTKVLGKKST